MEFIDPFLDLEADGYWRATRARLLWEIEARQRFLRAAAHKDSSEWPIDASRPSEPQPATRRR
jgi:hypothetical protein